MLKFLKRALLVLVVMVALFAGFVALQPADYSISRSARIAAPPEEVFAQVNDFHSWEAWSPWAKLDPDSKVTFEGPSAGKDAVFTWSGNDQVGAGRMKITESHPSDLIRIKLDFIKPFEDTCQTEFTFTPEGDETLVTWTMSGRKDFMGKAVCLFMDMDKMVGGDFEKGLSSIKAQVESAKK